MNVEVHTPDADEQLMAGPDEVWVQVTDDSPLPDWPTVRTHLAESHPSMKVPALPARYFPSMNMSDEPEKTGTRFSDIWVFRKVVI